MLYIVATPIGNLKDITLRAIETLSSVDVIFAEDTRVAGKLLACNNISKPTYRYDEHSHSRAIKEVLAFLEQEKSVAFISDAGTPGISDPGTRLVQSVRELLPRVKIIPIPGVSALTSILSVSGIDSSMFSFFGFPPHKKGRTTFFKRVALSDIPIVFYESPHRIQKAFEALAKEDKTSMKLVVGRELTKIYEDIFIGTPKEALSYFVGEKLKGEFVVVKI
ncbi:16S rRNA (cytidine(1402)-2'-O)-methyltransferase [Candidatus Parcubacteria bacterium]|jgi:16S rRNA (cytidine1402-2'-O)-methyltransferase|nr:MAG: 16S rRNA (cytidine(1402)-2'-O)-methyltransferase [Candidatus Parcubacteria bacterium]